jgi:lipoate-protein ligase A
MTQTWGLLELREIDSINTQSIWHAAALEREQSGFDNLLFIDWPNKPFVSVGYHQDPKEEVDLSYCEKQGYDVYRRACGGGQVFLDGNQVFYHMITNPQNSQLAGSTETFYQKLLQPVVATYQELDVPAAYSPINDIVARGKKISGNGAATLGNSRILTGNFILSFPSKEMSKVLRVPDEKFRDKVAQSLEERVGSFESLTGNKPSTDNLINTFCSNCQETLDIELVPIELANAITKRMNELNTTYRTDEWKFALHGKSSQLRAVKIKGDVFVSESIIKTAAGLLKGIFVFEDKIIKDLTLRGDVSVDPIDGLNIIEQDLIGSSVDQSHLSSVVNQTLAKLDAPGINADDILNLVKSAAGLHKES